VVIDDMTERPNEKGAFIQAGIFVEKDSQKAIIIGSRGSMIREIGRASRARIEEFLGYRVYLDLQVKVEKKWRDSPASLKKLGYR
jgi:GTP-binding protein Era